MSDIIKDTLRSRLRDARKHDLSSQTFDGLLAHDRLEDIMTEILRNAFFEVSEELDQEAENFRSRQAANDQAFKEAASFDCVRCGSPTYGKTRFENDHFVCFDLEGCVARQKTIREATTTWVRKFSAAQLLRGSKFKPTAPADLVLPKPTAAPKARRKK